MKEEDKKLKILIVDDDRFLLDMYSLKFKKYGLEVDAMGSSLSALDKLRTGSVYDILILDIIMPSIDGLEFLKRVREEKLVPSAIVIMLTNQADDFEKAKNLDIDGYIIKATTIPSEVVDQVLAVYKSKHK
ncbi:MAG TPA: response regulator [Candidatus Paceibacterota bacterium]|nr:response regulator ArlR [uncultured archaeon]